MITVGTDHSFHQQGLVKYTHISDRETTCTFREVEEIFGPPCYSAPLVIRPEEVHNHAVELVGDRCGNVKNS